jgi:hypothetical protein
MELAPIVKAVDKAINFFAARATVPSAWRTADWAQAPAAIVNRAFFSAGVESANFLDNAQRNIAQALLSARDETGALMNRERFIVDMRRRAVALGIATPEGKPTDLQNLAGATRLGMIYDMNRDAALGRARRASGLSEGALFAAPAQELIRGRQAKIPRDWRARWADAGGPDNAAPRMIALKTDPVWEKLSRFGVPWAPFDFGSGMILKNIRRAEAISYGLLESDAILKASPDPEFNDGLAGTLLGAKPEIIQALKAFMPSLKIEAGKAVLA